MVLAGAVASWMVPVLVMGPPVRPVPVLTCTTEPVLGVAQAGKLEVCVSTCPTNPGASATQPGTPLRYRRAPVWLEKALSNSCVSDTAPAACGLALALPSTVFCGMIPRLIVPEVVIWPPESP